MRTKKINGVTYIHIDDYRESPGIVVDHVLVDYQMKKIVGNMRMAASRCKKLNKKLERRLSTQRWVPAVYRDNDEENKKEEDIKRTAGATQ